MNKFFSVVFNFFGMNVNKNVLYKFFSMFDYVFDYINFKTTLFIINTINGRKDIY